MPSFRQTVAAAVRDFRIHGYDSAARLERWMKLLHDAAQKEFGDPAKQRIMLEQSLRAIYRRLVDNRGAMRTLSLSDTGPARFTIEKVLPHLRAELDRRIEASAYLIKDNKTEAIAATLRRFSGWATSQPAGGSAEPETRKAEETVKKALGSLSYAERRVIIDQGHKLTANITAVIAEGAGAIAAKWYSHWRQPNYNYRHDHKDRDGKVYLIRGSWAVERGLVKVGPDGWSDSITQPGEEVFCRCKFQYIFHVSKLPDTMVTLKGRQELDRVKKQMAA